MSEEVKIFCTDCVHVRTNGRTGWRYPECSRLRDVAGRMLLVYSARSGGACGPDAVLFERKIAQPKLSLAAKLLRFLGVAA